MEYNQSEGLLPIGSKISNGRYVIDAYLASGGFGKTYAATDTNFDEKVAIKELYIKGVCGRQADSTKVSVSLTENITTFGAQQEKFKKEARRLRKLTNDRTSAHIVRVHDLFDDNGTSYYVMDLVDGRSLSEQMKLTGKPLTEAEVWRILPQVLDALETVHAEGIWHLDLKPGNIMKDSKGDVFLIDFGASKQLRNSSGESLSTSSAMAYTPGFAPSEQMEQNIDKFGPWTDIYALGATLYNLLTRRTPPSPSDIDEDAEAALPFPADISKEMQKLILWMMKPKRTKRPQSVNDIRQFLAKKKTIDVEPPRKPQPATDDNATVIAGKKKPNGGSTGGGVGKWIAVAAIVAIGVFGIVKLMSKDGGTEVVAPAVEAETEDMLSHIENHEVDLHKCGVTYDLTDITKYGLDKYTYTGDVNADTLANGQGRAVFADGRIYEGQFDAGRCTDDNATFTFPNGDKFVGKIKDGLFVEGQYTIKEDGSVFTGTFKDGQPDRGSWK